MTDTTKSTVPPIEAIVDAIAKRNRIEVPSSLAYQLRSPLLIKSFARPGQHVLDEEGRRVFPSLLSGYKASVYDMELKVRGLSRAGLKPTDKVRNLLGVYGIKDYMEVDSIVSFLRFALKDMSISKDTPLSYFAPEVPEDGNSNDNA